jgi:hypothetical protein
VGVIEDHKPPMRIDQLGIPEALVQDLTLRRTLFEGKTSTVRLSDNLGVSLPVMSKVIEELRDLRHVEILGMEGRDYIVELTGQGRETAQERMKLSRYAGFAPVGLKDYVETVKKQTAHPVINHELMRESFKDLVVADALVDELGSALLTEGAMFLYGPPGTGKTSVAERLIRVYGDYVIVPRAVEVDNQIITMFDPVIHELAPEQPPDLDPRWVLCRRPSIVVGGELTGDRMELTYESGNGVYLAPIQMQANNGLLVIDDFGRQVLTPEQLLNRWIVPLDRRIDYLSLSYGVRFEIPFDVKVVFSTNLDPAALGDEAFFRRIQNKILVPSIADGDFDEVLHRASAHYGMALTPGAPEYLRWVSRTRGDGDLRPYLPKEVCKIVRAVSQYHGTEPILDRETIDLVASIYFTQRPDRPPSTEAPPSDPAATGSAIPSTGAPSSPGSAIPSAGGGSSPGSNIPSASAPAPAPAPSPPPPAPSA